MRCIIACLCLSTIVDRPALYCKFTTVTVVCCSWPEIYFSPYYVQLILRSYIDTHSCLRVVLRLNIIERVSVLKQQVLHNFEKFLLRKQENIILKIDLLKCKSLNCAQFSRRSFSVRTRLRIFSLLKLRCANLFSKQLNN